MSADRWPAGEPASRRQAVVAGARLGWNTGSGSLGDVVLDRTSNPLTAFHILSFVALWGVFVESFGHEPASLRELAQATKRPNRTIDRWASKFRTAFPEYSTPAVLWSQVRADLVEDELFPQELDADHLALQIGAARL